MIMANDSQPSLNDICLRYMGCWLRKFFKPRAITATSGGHRPAHKKLNKHAHFGPATRIGVSDFQRGFSVSATL